MYLLVTGTGQIIPGFHGRHDRANSDILSDVNGAVPTHIPERRLIVPVDYVEFHVHVRVGGRLTSVRGAHAQSILLSLQNMVHQDGWQTQIQALSHTMLRIDEYVKKAIKLKFANNEMLL